MNDEGGLAPSISDPASNAKPNTTKRGTRACLNCRRLKKVCDGGEPLCQRCRTNGATCVYDKLPAPPAQEYGGSERLGAIESKLSFNELVMQAVLQKMGDMDSNVSRILQLVQANTATSLPSASASANHSVPPFSNMSRRTVHVPILDSSFIPRQPVSLPASPADTLHQAAGSAPPIPTDDVEESVSFESALHAPIEALARAADHAQQFLPQDQSRLAYESQLAEHQGPLEGRAAGRPEEEDDVDGNYPPKKRLRIALLPASTSGLKRTDVVSGGLVSEREAMDWVHLWMHGLQPYCAILDPAFDTFDSLRHRKPFLFNTIVYLAARTQGGPSPPSKTLVAVAEETRAFAQSLIFETSPPLDVIQALILMAVWHDEPYMLSGYALRMAASIRLDRSFAFFDAHGWDKSDAKAQELAARVRCWMYLVYLDFKHSASTGRLILISPRDIDIVEKNADKIFLSPFSIPDDNRTVANLKLTIFFRKIIGSSPPLKTVTEGNLAAHVDYLRSMEDVLTQWHKSYDSALAETYPRELDWSRRSQSRIHSDGRLFLSCLVFKHTLLQSSPHPSITAIAHEAFRNAHSSFQTVLHSAIYTNSLKYCGFLTRVDLSFACHMALKLAAIYPELAEPEELANDVMRVADLLASCSGSQRYSLSLRVARDHFLAKTCSPQTKNKPLSDPISALQRLSDSQQATANNALLPGEMEIDWGSLANSFLDPSQLLTGDWVPYSTFSADSSSWLDDFALGD